MEHFDLTTAATPMASAAGAHVPNPILAMFLWWNDAMTSDGGLTEAAFGEFYTEEAVLIVNSNVRAIGLVNLAEHYRKVRRSVSSVAMVLPVTAEAVFDRIAFVHCHTAVVDLSGERREEEAMAWASIDTGRISRLTVVAAG